MVIAHAVVLATTGVAMSNIPDAPGTSGLVLLALGGMLFGLLLAKVRTTDLLAHVGAFMVGVLASTAVVAEGLTTVSTSRVERLNWVGVALTGALQRTSSGIADQDQLVGAVMIGLMAWLVAYTSAWTLYRYGWLVVALLLPGAVTVVSLGRFAERDAMPLAVVVMASCVLAARFHAFTRQLLWQRVGLRAPGRLAGRFLFAGLMIALVAAVIGWTVPLSAREGLGSAWSRLGEPLAAVQGQIESVIEKLGGPSSFGGGSYSDFRDNFQLGGELNLTDEPVMVVRPVEGSSPPDYLVGRRYDEYTGHGWDSSTERTFDSVNDAGQEFSPQMTFARGQAVHLSPYQGTQQTQAEVQMLTDRGDQLFTRDTYLTSDDLRTSVQLAWRQLDNEVYDLGAGTGAVPIDLQQFAQLLIGTQFEPTSIGNRPVAVDATNQAAINDSVEELRNRFIDVRWTITPEGTVDQLIVSGQLPVYDDVEAVFASDALPADRTYTVTGLASRATANQLREAGTSYPTWVTDRYLQLPETVTQRTQDLAGRLSEDATNPYDKAIAIQEFLRSTITYNENIAAPPRDQDVVDYVVFDSREGYCEYYASAMAVMLRSQGVPARVVGGYYPAPWDEQAQGYLYRQENAHLWVEAYFPGYGWIPFEPTASQEEISYGDVATAVPSTPVPTPAPTPTTEPSPATPTPPAGGGITLPPPPDINGLLDQPSRIFGIAGLVALLAGLTAVAALVVVWNWRLRGLPPMAGFFARMTNAATLTGLRQQETQTPQEFAQTLGMRVPGTGGAATVVADRYAEEAFSGRPVAPEARADVLSAWRDLRRRVLGGMLRRNTG